MRLTEMYKNVIFMRFMEKYEIKRAKEYTKDERFGDVNLLVRALFDAIIVLIEIIKLQIPSFVVVKV